MKIRTNYVSNSSSTSFIIAYNESSALVIEKNGKKFTVMTFNEFLEMIDEKHSANGWCSESTRIVASGYENIKDWLNEEDWRDSEWSQGILKSMNESKKDFSEFIIMNIEYSDKMSRRLLDLFECLKEIKLLSSENE